MRFTRTLGPALIVASMVGLSACATGPTIRADTDPSVDLSSYRTFGFFEKVSTDKTAYTTLVSTRLKEATRRELEKRGYLYSSANPQLLANFGLNVLDKQEIRSTPTASVGYGYYGYRAGMYGVWGGYPQDIDTINYKEGTLTIDLVDASKKQLIWQGTAQGRVDKKAIENPGPAIDAVVGEIFARFPVPVPGVPAQ